MEEQINGAREALAEAHRDLDEAWGRFNLRLGANRRDFPDTFAYFTPLLIRKGLFTIQDLPNNVARELGFPIYQQYRNDLVLEDSVMGKILILIISREERARKRVIRRPEWLGSSRGFKAPRGLKPDLHVEWSWIIQYLDQLETLSIRITDRQSTLNHLIEIAEEAGINATFEDRIVGREMAARVNATSRGGRRKTRRRSKKRRS